MGGSRAKHCTQCVASKSTAELYGSVKVVGMCPGTPGKGSGGERCDKPARNNRCKYCKECGEGLAEERERKRREVGKNV